VVRLSVLIGLSDVSDKPINTDRRTTKSQFLTRQCRRQTSTQETGGCMYG
jgi:hypothetical protein